jgi:hypothetical protein
MQQVNAAVGELEQMTPERCAGGRKRRAAGAMSEQAAVLERLVGRFKLDEATQQLRMRRPVRLQLARAADAQLTWRRSSRLHAGDVTRARVALPAQQIENSAPAACGPGAAAP